MTHRNTRRAYETIVRTGALPAAQMAVYRLLVRTPKGLTRNEIDARLSPGTPNPTHSRRLTELEARGVARRDGERACTVTGATSDVWVAVQGVMPGPRPKKTPPGLRRRQLEAYGDIVERLKRGLPAEQFVAEVRIIALTSGAQL